MYLLIFIGAANPFKQPLSLAGLCYALVKLSCLFLLGLLPLGHFGPLFSCAAHDLSEFLVGHVDLGKDAE